MCFKRFVKYPCREFFSPPKSLKNLGHFYANPAVFRNIGNIRLFNKETTSPPPDKEAQNLENTSKSSSSETTFEIPRHLIGPAPSQLPFPGEPGYKEMMENLKKFLERNYPTLSYTEWKNLGEKHKDET